MHLLSILYNKSLTDVHSKQASVRKLRNNPEAYKEIEGTHFPFFPSIFFWWALNHCVATHSPNRKRKCFSGDHHKSHAVSEQTNLLCFCIACTGLKALTWNLLPLTVEKAISHGFSLPSHFQGVHWRKYKFSNANPSKWRFPHAMGFFFHPPHVVGLLISHCRPYQSTSAFFSWLQALTSYHSW